MLHLLHRLRGDVSEVEVTVSNRTLIRIIIIVLITIAIVAAILKVTNALLLLFIAFFLALALNAPVVKIASWLPGKAKDSRLLGTTIVYLIVVLLLVAFGAYIIPPFIHQTAKFIAAAPHLVKETQNQHTALGHFVRDHHLQNLVNTISKDSSKWLSNIGGKAFSSVLGVLEDIVSVLAVLALTFMMLIEGPRWLSALRELLFASESADSVNRVTREIYRVVRGYVNGQVVLAFIASVLVGPALFIMGVSYPIALMVVVFICGLIPLIGHPIGAIIITIVALFHSLSAAIVVLIWYIVYINFENYLLQPRIQASATKMSPLLVLAAIIIGVSLAGLIGGLVAIPVAGSLRVLVLEYLAKRRILPKEYMRDEAAGP